MGDVREDAEVDGDGVVERTRDAPAGEESGADAPGVLDAGALDAGVEAAGVVAAGVDVPPELQAATSVAAAAINAAVLPSECRITRSPPGGWQM